MASTTGVLVQHAIGLLQFEETLLQYVVDSLVKKVSTNFSLFACVFAFGFDTVNLVKKAGEKIFNIFIVRAV